MARMDEKHAETVQAKVKAEMDRLGISGRRKASKSTASQSTTVTGEALCPICGDPITRVNPGRYYAQLPDGTLKVRTCPQCEGGTRALAEWQAAVMAGYPNSRIPANLAGASLADLPGKLAQLLATLVERRSFELQDLRWTGVHLYGENGVGKSYAAAAALSASIGLSVPGLFLKVSAFLDELRGTYDPDSGEKFMHLYRHVVNAPLLVLDDWGVQQNTDWAREKLFGLIDDRYGAGLPMILTSNFSLEELRTMSDGNWTEQRMISRLIGSLYPIRLSGEDRRVR